MVIQMNSFNDGTHIRLELDCFNLTSRKHVEQLLREASWIITNLGRAKGLEEKNKWMQKWFNWSDAHPKEAEQIKKQVEACNI